MEAGEGGKDQEEERGRFLGLFRSLCFQVDLTYVRTYVHPILVSMISQI